ncbi:MAG: AIM24 family protein, partial [Patescibacteria group bacterium]|nr:AIM24 family protein [Patescibacteria group bacterium]
MSDANGWYLAQGSKSVGPMTLDQLIRRLDTAQGLDTLVYGPGAPEWIEARHVAAIVGPSAGEVANVPPPPPSGRRADVIDYELFGDEMQYAEITLDPGETVIAEAGAMMYMTAGIKMETVLGDPSAEEQSFFSKVVTAGKRALTGESVFLTTFTNEAAGREKIAFA